METIIGDKAFISKLKPEDFADETFGVPTIKDILKELEKPGRDPRPEFKTATFQDGIEQVTDLKPGMRLEGVVTNVTAFGAFVDIGVHQDGLVHISEMSDTFIKDPHEVVKTGQVVSVVVMDVDVARKRIGLSMKQGGKRPAGPAPKGGAAPAGKSAAAKEQSKPSDSPFSVLSRLK